MDVTSQTHDNRRANGPGVQVSSRPGKEEPVRVLLIDDSPIVLGLIESELSELGYNVEIAASGFTGMETFFNAKFDYDAAFDVVVTDLNMPDFGGLDVLGNVRSAAPEVPVILLSSAGDMKLVRQAMREGAFDYVIKDEGLDPLADAIDRAVAQGEKFKQDYEAVDEPFLKLQEATDASSSGEFIAVSEDCEIHVHLQTGRIAWATSSKMKYAFTRYLVEQFSVDPDLIKLVIQRCRRGSTNVGESLVKAKVATQEQVRESLRLQMRDALITLREMTTSNTVFLPRNCEYSVDLTVTLDEAITN